MCIRDRFNTLRQAILKGELAPGERLMEIQLAEKLGVSRTPIREALKMLMRDDLVEIRDGVGTFVKSATQKDIEDAYAAVSYTHLDVYKRQAYSRPI